MEEISDKIDLKYENYVMNEWCKRWEENLLKKFLKYTENP